MLRSRLLQSQLLAVVGTALLAGGLPAAALAADPPVTLRMAIVDTEDQTQGANVHRFMDEVAARSGGSVTIQPVWDAGGGPVGGYEQAVAKQLAGGQADLAMVPSRGWDAAGITSLSALEAPLLIDEPAIGAAVATSPIADELLAAMEPGGVIGLALWPEDFTHPVQGGCLDPIVDPGRLEGAVIRTVPSAVIADVVATLGATQVFYNDYLADVGACKINALFQGMRRTAGGLTITGDVTLFPRMDTLAANAATFGRLSEAQQTAIREAAVSTRDAAIADEPSEADLAVAWCGLAGTVVLAGPDGIAGFERALQPVTDRLTADPLAAKAIEAIRALKATTTRSPGAQACEPPPVPSLAPVPTFDLSQYQGTLPPDGTYRTDVTTEDLVRRHADARFATVQAGVYTLVFQGDTVLFQQGNTAFCPNGASSDGTVFSIREQVPDTCLGGDYKWREVPGGIELVPLVDGWPHQDQLDFIALFNRVWTRIE